MRTIHKFHQVLSIFFIVALLFSNLQTPPVQAQSGDGLNRERNAQNGKVSFITPANGRPLSAAKALGTFIRPQDPSMALAIRYAPEFGIQNPQRDLTVMKQTKSVDGRLTVRYQQHYQGIPVMGGELLVNTNSNGDLYSINGEASPNLSLQTQPTIDSQQATQTTLAEMAKWYQKSMRDFVVSTPELWIYDESLLQPSTRPAELVWRMEVTAKDNALPVRELVLVNAQRGSISLHFNQIDNDWGDSLKEQMPQGLAAAQSSSSPNNQNLSSEPVVTKTTITRIPVLSGGVTWYVATTGSDANDCATTTTPCATIQGAANLSANGDTIEVAVGTYVRTYNQQQVVFISKSTTISGGWDSTFTAQNGYSTIDGQNTYIGISTNSTIPVILSRLIIINGNSGGLGGVYNSGNLTINNSYIQRNSSGGIYNTGNLTLNNTAISDNFGYQGAGIKNTGTLTINNSTISNNSTYSGSGGVGGGIYTSGTTTLNNTTVSNNSAYWGGGIYREGNFVTFPITLANSILSGNTATSGPDCYYAITSNGNNILSTTSGCSVNTNSGDKFNINPLLGTFLPTQGYQPLLSNSPAINAGNPATCLPTDQRGVARVGTCDIGAYEYATPGSAASLSIFNGSKQSTAPLMAFSKSLQAVVLDNVGSPVPNINVTFTAPASSASGTFANTGTNLTAVLTDMSGLAATTVFTANNESGAYIVSASAPSLSSVDFKLANIAWYVSPSGNDSNSCSISASPCLTINGAIGKAIAGDTILVATATYTGTGSAVVSVDKSVILSGGWNASFTTQNSISTVDAQNARLGINVNASGSTVSLDRFIVKNGCCSGYGGGIAGGAMNLTITNSSLQNNYAYEGGGVFVIGNLTLNNVTINNNSASSVGGGIFVGNYSNLTLNNVTVSNNSASSGGAFTIMA